MAGSCSAHLRLILAAAALTLAAGSRPSTVTARARSVSLLQQRAVGSQKLNVAMAAVVPYGALNSSSWRDGLAVMAYSARKAAAKSKHRITLLALLPDTIARKEEERKVLAELGLEARFVPVPVPLKEVKTAFARKELALVLGEMEQLKYYGAGLTEFDRVVILDGDTMFLSPIDELFTDTHGAKLLGIYDHELDIDCSVFPPLNTGFLVFTPDKRDFDALNDLVREGDFRDGTGWEGSNTGWTYGTGSQGVLSFYYNQKQPGVPGYIHTPPKKGKDLPGLPFTEQPPTSRFKPLDRSVYNVIDTTLLKEAIDKGRTDASRVKVFHFTGGCMKPWTCDPADAGICQDMTERWWAMRAELAKEWGVESGRCEDWGSYQALKLPKHKTK